MRNRNQALLPLISQEDHQIASSDLHHANDDKPLIDQSSVSNIWETYVKYLHKLCKSYENAHNVEIVTLILYIRGKYIYPAFHRCCWSTIFPCVSIYLSFDANRKIVVRRKVVVFRRTVSILLFCDGTTSWAPPDRHLANPEGKTKRKYNVKNRNTLESI